MNKKNHYQNKAGLLCVLCLLLLAQGCQKQNNAPQTSQNPAVSQNAAGSDAQSMESEQEEYPETVTETLAERVTVDADVDIPEGFDFQNAKTGCAKVPLLDCEEAKKIFMGNTKIAETSEDAIEGIRDILYIGEDGSSLDIEPEEGYLSYSTPLRSYIRQAVRIEEGFSDYNGNCYSMSENLPFADREEVLKEIRSQMARLGIVIGDDYVCYALPHKTMEEQEIAYDKYGDECEENKKEKWTEEDDCYYFKFNLDFDGMPVDMEGYGDCEDGKGMVGSELSVMYGKNGFVDVDIVGLYSISDTGRTEKMLTPKEALEALKAKYDSLILTEDYLVEHMELRYVPMFDAKGNYPVEPVWIFTVVTGDEELGMDYKSRVLIGSDGKEVF